MVTAVTRIQSISRSGGGSAPRDDLYNPERQRRPGHLDEPQRQISPVKPSSPRQSSRQDHRNQMSPLHNLTLLQLELNCWYRLARGELAPRLNLVSPKVFFSILSPMEFWFLAAVTSGLLSWGHFISSDIVDLIAQILFKLN